MISKNFLNKTGLLLAFCAMTSAGAEPIRGLFGGFDSLNAPWAGFIPASSDTVIPIPFSISNGSINSVALNNSSIGLLGGRAFGDAYLATIDSSLTLTRVLGTPKHANIESVALNDFNVGIAVGEITVPSGPYVAIISSNHATEINTGLSSGTIFSTAINNSNLGLIGGVTNLDMYAALVSPTISIIPITGLTTGEINAVAINDSGFGLVGGGATPSTGIAYVIPSSSNVATQVFLDTAVGSVLTVALNNSGTGIIAGGGVQIGERGFVDILSGGTTMAVLRLPPSSQISAAAINNAGLAIVGGIDENEMAYAAILTTGSGFVTPISLDIFGTVSGAIQQVAINDFGQALIGGTVDNTAFVALVDGNTAFPLLLNIPDISGTRSVALANFLPMLSNIPTNGLTGNNKAFAKYINKNAPQKAFYFVPSEFDGTLTEALQSSAPTRNAISFNTVLQNAFYLTTSLATHLRDQPFFRKRGARSQPGTTAVNVNEKKESLIASLHCPEQKACPETCVKEKEDPCHPSTPYSIWFDALGAFAFQSHQHQTPAFDPTTGGAILGFDSKVGDFTRVGCGASYLYTHVHEKHNAGHSNINQEALFLYSSWNSHNFYLDLAAWGGLFQTDQKRNIQMSGFAFTSKSNVSGGMLTPHLELGYNGIPTYTQHFQFTYNPFGMLDWANGWQDSYKEKGTGPFNAGQKSHWGSLLRAELGVRFNEVFFFRNWNLLIQEKGSYVNTQSFSAGQVNAFLIGSPGSFTVETLTSSQNLGVAQLLVSFAPLKPVYPVSTIFYQGEFGSGYQSHQLNVEFAWNF